MRYPAILIALLIASTAHAEQYATVLQFPAGQKGAALLPGNAIRDVSIDGAAGIRDYPWSYNQWHQKPDVTGPDCPQLADGYVLDGFRPCGSHLSGTQIAGTIYVLKGSYLGCVERLYGKSAINGIRVEATDVQLRQINLENIIHESVTVLGGGNVFIDVSHVTGGDIGYHFFSRALCTSLFADNERIGGILESGADQTQIDGYAMMGCWEAGLVINTSEANVSHLNGSVPAATADHPAPCGVKFMPHVINSRASGSLMVGEGGTGVIVRGNDNHVDLIAKAAVAGQKTSTLIKLDGPIHKSDITLDCPLDSGPAIDATTAQLDETDTITFYGSLKRIVGDTGKATVIIHEVGK